MKKPTSSDGWISSGEAASILGVSHETVARLARENKFPAWKPAGRDIRMKRADVLAYLESTRVKTKGGAACGN